MPEEGKQEAVEELDLIDENMAKDNPVLEGDEVIDDGDSK